MAKARDYRLPPLKEVDSAPSGSGSSSADKPGCGVWGRSGDFTWQLNSRDLPPDIRPCVEDNRVGARMCLCQWSGWL